MNILEVGDVKEKDPITKEPVLATVNDILKESNVQELQVAHEFKLQEAQEWNATPWEPIK